METTKAQTKKTHTDTHTSFFLGGKDSLVLRPPNLCATSWRSACRDGPRERQAGVGLSDAKDPLGEWCYVDPGLCPDEQAPELGGGDGFSSPVPCFLAELFRVAFVGFARKAKENRREEDKTPLMGNLDFAGIPFVFGVC